MMSMYGGGNGEYPSAFSSRSVTKLIKKDEPLPAFDEEQSRKPMPLKEPKKPKYLPGERLLMQFNKQKDKIKKKNEKISSDDMKRIERAISNVVIGF
jgi:hypothetical protein